MIGDFGRKHTLYGAGAPNSLHGGGDSLALGIVDQGTLCGCSGYFEYDIDNRVFVKFLL